MTTIVNTIPIEEQCKRCNGWGIVGDVSYCNGVTSFLSTPCPECFGTGRKIPQIYVNIETKETNMGVTFWSYDEMVEHINEYDCGDVFHFEIVPCKLGIELIKLPTMNENFKENQIVYREVNRLNGSNHEYEWQIANRYLKLYDVLTSLFIKWWKHNNLPDIFSPQ